MDRELLQKSELNIAYLRDLGTIRSRQCELYFSREVRNLGDQRSAIAACQENEILMRRIAEMDNKDIGAQEDYALALIHLAEIKSGMDNEGAANDLLEAQRRITSLPGTVTKLKEDWEILNQAKAKLEIARRGY